MNYIIKQIKKTELPECTEVIRRSFETVACEFGLSIDNCPTNPAFITSNILILDYEKGNMMYGLYADDRIAGFMKLVRTNSDCYELGRLSVLPEYRHKGYGRALIEYAKDIVIKNSGVKIKIGIIDKNTVLKNWYIKNGFVQTELREFPHLPFIVCFMEMEITLKDRMMLVFPTLTHKDAAMDYKNEYFINGENIIHGDGGLDCTATYEEWLVKITNDLDKNKITANRVPSTTYFAVIDDRIVGTIQIRHELNAFLLSYGGHIGYGIRPTERRKGYATKMLSLALEKSKALGLKRVLVSCDKANIGSAKTIINNGGILENEVTEENGNVYQRYWIDLE
ncbi:MAG: acetyltransferase [Clostridia bacterium]|nr:acetyltransferase [Clostridia bacterium]